MHRLTYCYVPVDAWAEPVYFYQFEDKNDDQRNPRVRHCVQVETKMSGTVPGIPHPSGHQTESNEC